MGPWARKGHGSARAESGRSLVALTPVRDLLLFAKHLFVAAMTAIASGRSSHCDTAATPAPETARVPQRREGGGFGTPKVWY